MDNENGHVDDLRAQPERVGGPTVDADFAEALINFLANDDQEWAEGLRPDRCRTSPPRERSKSPQLSSLPLRRHPDERPPATSRSHDPEATGQACCRNRQPTESKTRDADQRVIAELPHRCVQDSPQH